MHCDLYDLGYTGTPFTWYRSRLSPYSTKARLDRFIACPQWSNVFPSSKIEHVFTYASYHKPIILTASANNLAWAKGMHRKTFRFEAKWTRIAESEDVIRRSWLSNDDLSSKLRICGRDLTQWRKWSGIPSKREISLLKARIDNLQQGIIIDGVKSEIQSLSYKLYSLLEQEDLHWRQRSKLHWLANGDRNTSYFHSFASKRREVNHIQGLKDSTGQWCKKPEDIKRIIEKHFGELFSTSEPSAEDINIVLERVQPKVSENMNRRLAQPYTGKEVSEALA